MPIDENHRRAHFLGHRARCRRVLEEIVRFFVIGRGASTRGRLEHRMRVVTAALESIKEGYRWIANRGDAGRMPDGKKETSKMSAWIGRWVAAACMLIASLGAPSLGQAETT